MSYKVVRDPQNNVVAYGPDDGNYEPTVPQGCTVNVEQNAPETPIAVRQGAAIAKTYRDVDDIYAIAIGNRAEEYKQAEIDARAFAAAGYTGTPTEYVSGWATAKGMTNQQSADAIIARADALVAAKLSLRNQRFTSQAEMLAATTTAELDAAVVAWDAYVVATKVALA